MCMDFIYYILTVKTSLLAYARSKNNPSSSWSIRLWFLILLYVVSFKDVVIVNVFLVIIAIFNVFIVSFIVIIHLSYSYKVRISYRVVLLVFYMHVSKKFLLIVSVKKTRELKRLRSKTCDQIRLYSLNYKLPFV